MKRSLFSSAILASALVACGGQDRAAPPPATPTPPPPAPVQPAPPPADVLGSMPAPSLTPAFQPPSPVVYQTANGITVWLLERHALPVVAVTLAIPSGSASDDAGRAGLAAETADMLDEGAGKLGSVAFAAAVDEIGARFSTGATDDTSFAGIGVLKSKLAQGMKLLGDAVVRPRFDAKDWKRVHDLWVNDLKQRDTEPRQVADVVMRAVLYGPNHPYGHPVDGLVASAPKVGLGDVKRFYAQTWRPDRAVVVVVGDVTRAEIDPQIDAAFGAWKKPATAAPAITTPAAPSEITTPAGAPPRVVLVDRPDAPQSIVAWARGGVAESDARLPALHRLNLALGGTFTSRLNQDLREAHGWSYGAHSHVDGQRGVGRIVASAAVVTDKTVDALKAMLGDLDTFAHDGLKDDEVERTRLYARNEVVEHYETVDHTSFRLAHDAALGLAPDYEATASVAMDSADKDALNKLAAAFYDHRQGVVVLVGPKDKLAPALSAAGFTSIETRDAEGNVVTAKPADDKAAATKNPAAKPGAAAKH